MPSTENDPFKDGKISGAQPAGKKRGGLVVGPALTSAELEAKFGAMTHHDLPIAWPVQFLDEHGRPQALSPGDVAMLAHIGVTEEEFWLIELGDRS